MSDEEIKNMIEDLYKQRVAHRSHNKPTSHKSYTHSIVNMDFASLYPSTQRMYFGKKSIKRKRKIENIFN